MNVNMNKHFTFTNTIQSFKDKSIASLKTISKKTTLIALAAIGLIALSYAFITGRRHKGTKNFNNETTSKTDQAFTNHLGKTPSAQPNSVNTPAPPGATPSNLGKTPSTPPNNVNIPAPPVANPSKPTKTPTAQANNVNIPTPPLANPIPKNTSITPASNKKGSPLPEIKPSLQPTAKPSTLINSDIGFTDLRQKKWFNSETHVRKYGLDWTEKYNQKNPLKQVFYMPVHPLSIPTYVKHNKVASNGSIPEAFVSSFPINSNHHILIYVSPKTRKIEYYDSKVNYGSYDEMMKNLQKVAKELDDILPGAEPFTVEPKITKNL